MFKVGDLIIYSVHGVCQIDTISVKTLSDVSKHYYDLHPLSNPALKISTPVDNKSVLMLNLIQRDEAEELIESFKSPELPWIENNNVRSQTYSKIVNTGNRKEIANIANTLLRRKHLVELNQRKFGTQDQNLLSSIQSILFSEMAISMETTYDVVAEKVNRIVAVHQSN